ncbi:hypothetical protein [Micromonospora tarensis]|uniref:Uncharacterized protein n=1 Tax=Micromonospora tarensis TaxID=2806100 RepID=A0ABS1YCG7_9ACTN|nr:hypothetical protein [Micromonospora tarensis]MBM0275111.1 hypothetical protein [Micromonospora tarensis]
MTNPHNHHATRAAWSLAAARTHLDNAVTNERDTRRAEARTIAAAGAIQAWRPMPGPSGQGGHGDLVGRTAVSTLEPEYRDGHLARLATSTTATLAWLAAALRLPAGDPGQQLAHAAPTLRPTTAREITLWLDEADTRIRDALGRDPDGHPLAGVRCPRCARRQLVAHTTGPRTTWTVTCTTSCVCTGPDCPCTMPVRLADVAHIWGPTHPLTTGVLAAA